MYPIRILKALAFLYLVLILSACRTNNVANVEIMEGSGVVVSEARDVTRFSSIQINLGADLALTQGDSERLTIETDKNLLPYIKTEIRNDRLIVYTPDTIELAATQTPQINVTFNTLRAIEILGNSTITGDELHLDELTVTFSGSGSTRLTGEVDRQTINILGQAAILNYGLSSHDVNVDISGNGTFEVNAQDSLNVIVKGMGNIHYTGNPMITQDVSGIANILSGS